MNESKEALKEIEAYIKTMPIGDVDRVRLAVSELKEVINRHGDVGYIAIAYIGAELAALGED